MTKPTGKPRGRPKGRDYPKRIQVNLDEEMHAKLLELARQRKISASEVIRRLLKTQLVVL